MKPIIKIMVRRSLMVLGAIVVWVKALGGRSADEQTPVNARDRSKDSGGSTAKAQP